MRGRQEVFVRSNRRPRERRPSGASRLSLVRQFERKEEMKAYPSDSERLGQSTNLTSTLAGLDGVSGQNWSSKGDRRRYFPQTPHIRPISARSIVVARR